MKYCECESPESSGTRCKRCWLQIDLQARKTPPASPAAPRSVTGDWIRGDIERGYSMDFIRRQYGSARVRRAMRRQLI